MARWSARTVMDERGARFAFWSMLVCAALLLLVGAGSIPLLDPDESRFARTSVEMLRSGDLVVPTFQGEPRLVKPPLLHWMQSALFRTFGVSATAARLPGAAATLGSLLLVGWIARRRFGYEGALWATVTLATMPLVVALGRLGTLDALLSLHVLAVVALDIAEPRETRGHRSLAIGALLGLAFLIKGPVGVVLPLLIMLAGRTAAGRQILPDLRSTLEAVAGWCVVVLPWGLALVGRVGPGAVLETLRAEALQRFFASVDHVEPAWYYLAVLAVGLFPWVVPLAAALVRAVARRDDPASRTAVYAAAGFVVGLVFFSLSSSKLANYILPLAPLAAVLVTWELGRELDAPSERVGVPLLLWASLGAVAVGLGLATRMGLDPAPRLVAGIGAALYGAAAVVALAGVLVRRPRWVYAAAAAAGALFLVVALLVLLPAIARTRTSAYLIEAMPQLRVPERPLLMVDMQVPSLTFYLDRVPEEVDLKDFERRLERDDDPLIVFDEVDLPRATQSARAKLREVGRQGKYIVFAKRKTR